MSSQVLSICISLRVMFTVITVVLYILSHERYNTIRRRLCSHIIKHCLSWLPFIPFKSFWTAVHGLTQTY